MKPKITYYDNGQIWIERWKNEAEKLHRLDGPAYRGWFKNGQLSSEDWYVNGLRHRLDGPACRGWFEDGQLEYEGWCINSQLHRLDGPAFQWYVNGRLQREQWFISEVEYKTKAEFQVAVDHYKANENSGVVLK